MGRKINFEWLYDNFFRTRALNSEAVKKHQKVKINLILSIEWNCIPSDNINNKRQKKLETGFRWKINFRILWKSQHEVDYYSSNLPSGLFLNVFEKTEIWDLICHYIEKGLLSKRSAVYLPVLSGRFYYWM